MRKVLFAIASIAGLTQALAARPDSDEVNSRIRAAQLSPFQSATLTSLSDLGTLSALRPGDYVFVTNGDSGGREIYQITQVDGAGTPVATVLLERNSNRIVADSVELQALTGLAVGDEVVVTVGNSGGREVHEVTSVSDAGQPLTTAVVLEQRSVDVTVSESVIVADGGVIALSEAPKSGLSSILNFGAVRYTDPDGVSGDYKVTQDDVTGAFAVDAELAGQVAQIQYVVTRTLSARTEAFSHSSMHQA